MITVSVDKTADEMATFLNAETSATELGTGSKIYRLTDTLDIQAEVELHGFTLIFSDTFYLKSSTTNGHIKAGLLENGTYNYGLTIIYEGSPSMSDNSITVASSCVQAGSKWTTYGLTVKMPAADNNNGVLNIVDSGSVSTFERLSIEVHHKTSCSTYFTIKLAPTAKISIYSLRNTNLRYFSGDLSFIENGEGWMRSQNNDMHLKILATNQVFKSFVPKYPTADAVIYTTATNFSPTTMTFRDSLVDSDKIKGYPAGNDAVVRIVERTINFDLVDNALNKIDDFSVNIVADRVVGANGYSGAIDGLVTKYTDVGKSSGTSQIIDVFRGYRAEHVVGDTRDYKTLKYTRSDKNLNISYRHNEYDEANETTNTEYNAYKKTTTLIKDNEYDATITKDSITGVSLSIINNTITISESRTVQEVYNYLKEQYVKDFVIDKFFSLNGKSLDLTSHNLVVDGATTILTGDIKTTGDVTFTNSGSINGIYPLPNNQVGIKCNVQGEVGIIDKVYGVWPKSQGLRNRTGIKTAVSGTIIAVDKNIDYYVVADAINAVRSDVVTVNSGNVGATTNIELKRIKKADGTNLLPDSLTTDGSYVASMIEVNPVDGKVHIKIPDDYATNLRYHSTSEQFVFTLEDCPSIQYQIERIQSTQASLKDPTTLGIFHNEIVVSIDSTLTIMQCPTNITRGIDVRINLSAFTFRRENDEKMLNTFIDNSNGVIQINGNAPLSVNINTPSSLLTEVTDTIPAKVDSSVILNSTKDSNVKLNNMMEEITKIDGTKYIRLKADALEEQDVVVNTSNGTSVDVNSISTTIWAFTDRKLTDTKLEKALIAYKYDLLADISANTLILTLGKVVADDYYNGHTIIVGNKFYSSYITDTVFDVTNNKTTVTLETSVGPALTGETVYILNKQDIDTMEELVEVSENLRAISNYESL